MTESQHALLPPQLPLPEKPVGNYPTPQFHNGSADPGIVSSSNPSAPPNGVGTSLQQALQRIKDLDEQNAKLYHDNCQLASTVQMLNERHLFVSKPQVIQLQQFAYIQELLRITEANRLVIAQQHQELLASIRGDTVSQQLAVQMQQTRLEHTQLLKEYGLLLERYTRLKSHYAMISPPNLPPQSVPASSPVSTCVPSQARNSNPVTVPRRSDMQPSGDISLDVSHSQRGSAATSSHRHQNFPFPHQTQQVHGHRRVSDSRAQQQLHSTMYSHRSTPPLPTPPPSASTAVAIPPRGFPLNASVEFSSRHAIKPYIPIPNASMVPVPPTMSVPSMLHQARQPYTQDTRPARGTPQSIDLPMEESATTPIVYFGPENPEIPSTSSTSNHLKRPSSAIDAPVAPEVEPKKLRTEDACRSSADASVAIQPPRQELLEMDKLNMAQITSPLAPVASVLGSEVSQHDVKPTAIQHEGLRSQEECVELIFERDAEVENGVYCEACLSRYEAGMLPDPPNVLINPDLDLLVKHCMTVHPTLWEDLRQRNDQT
ncbi:hypothetical protein SCLCIDRAFT_1209134 [Scleroderma citrinum Foug A]|uniref:Uncharacterized protein n=1 Tax=Scleroderma citrinum Foug A TaxID=1036808 RepID=A0A0C3EL22_9AGAM|nr:hypothetical protein SCLCIDRAFT_1209134 [Scleroderma citrinum Foug A]